MSLEDRVNEIELHLAAHVQTLNRIISLQEEQSGVMRDMLRLLGSIDDRLGSIEDYLRPPGRNGPQRQ